MQKRTHKQNGILERILRKKQTSKEDRDTPPIKKRGKYNKEEKNKWQDEQEWQKE